MARIPKNRMCKSLMLGKSLKNGVGIASGESWPPFHAVYVSGHKTQILSFLPVLWRKGIVDSGERVQEAAATFHHQPWLGPDEEILSLGNFTSLLLFYKVRIAI